MNESILVYHIGEDNLYTAPEIYTFKDKIKVGTYEDLEIDFGALNL